jgi:hypothetical protein
MRGTGSRCSHSPDRLIELAGRKCLILSDADKPAREQQKIFLADGGHGRWMTYPDIDSSLSSITGDDFLRNKFIALYLNKELSDAGISKEQVSDLPNGNKMKAIEKLFKDGGMTDQQLFNSLSPNDIEESYAAFLNGVVNALDGL